MTECTSTKKNDIIYEDKDGGIKTEHFMLFLFTNLVFMLQKSEKKNPILVTV